MFRAIRLPHPLEDRIRHRAAGHFVIQKLGSVIIGKRQDTRDHRDFAVLNAAPEMLEYRRIEDRLGQHKLCSSLDLVVKTL